MLERSFGSFRRDLSLAGDVDISKIEAECKNGVLTVTLPKYRQGQDGPKSRSRDNLQPCARESRAPGGDQTARFPFSE